MIRSTLICFGIGLLAGLRTDLRRRNNHPQTRASPARRDAGNLGEPQRALGISVRCQRPRSPRRLGKAGRRRLRPHHRGPVSLGEQAVRHSPAQRCARDRLVSPSVHGPQGVPGRAIGSGSGSARSIGGPTSGSMAERLSSTREGTRRSRPISPTPSSATARTSWSSARSTRPIRVCRPASRLAGTRPARASGRPSGSRRGPKSFIADFTMIPAIDPARVGFQVTVAGLPKETDFQVGAEARYFEGGPKLTASRAEKARDGFHTLRVFSAGPRAQALDPRNAPPLRRDSEVERRAREGHRFDPVVFRPANDRSRQVRRRAVRADPLERQAHLSSARPSTSRSTRTGSTRPPTTTS